MDAFVKDLKHSARMFLRTPGFTIAAVAALALGIAANTAIFSVVNTVLLKPFGYRDSGRIMMFQNTFPQGVRSGSASPTEFNWWRQQTQVFQDIAAYDFNLANWTGESFPEQISTSRVSAEFFRLCRANALYGRTFTTDDDQPNAAKTAVLAYSFWQRHFGADPRAIGTRIALNGERYEIIGVVRNGQIAEQSLLSGDIQINAPPEVYLPFQLDPNSASHGHFFNVAGRLKPGITIAAGSTALEASYRDYVRKWPGEDLPPGRGFGIQPLRTAIVGGVRHSLLILLGAVSFVMLIACANVANLMLARAAGRKREIAIRVAVGASRGRILRQLLTESVLLSLAGGVLGLLMGYAGIRAIFSLIPGQIPRIGIGGSNVNLDWRVLGFTLALSILTGIVFGLGPALQSSRAGWRLNKTRGLLVTSEVALAVVLLIGAALLIRSFVAIRQVNPGFDAHNVLTMRMSLADPRVGTPADVTRLIHEALRRIRALPGVESGAATCCVPLEDHFQLGFQIPGRPAGAVSGGVTGWTLVSADYFETFRIPVLRGRTFTEQDDSGPPVAIINATLAKQFWPNSDPLGAQVAIAGDSPRRIIGIVGDVRDRALDREPRPNLYQPSAQMRDAGLMTTAPWAWVVRTRGEPASFSSAIQKELREASGGLPVAQLRTMEEILWRSTAAEDFNALVLTIFGCSALLLAAIGIYGLVTFVVAQRTREMGIRLALGAESSRIRNMVVLQGMRPALAGVFYGFVAALGLTRFIASLLFGVKTWDPLVFVAVPVILAGVALVAVWLPAQRASRVDPIHALRHE
jgi:putative ABC transport system permease protein